MLALDIQRREAGQRVVKLRESRGWNQEDLAHAADVSVKTVSRLENGHRESRRATLEAVAAALEVEPDDILPRPAPLGLGLDALTQEPAAAEILERLAAMESRLATEAARNAEMQSRIELLVARTEPGANEAT